ncbi:integral membrane protein, partial [Lasiosphaeris hirsuta]
MDIQTEPNSVYQHRQDGLIITAVVMTVVAATFVIMRSTSRFIVIRNPGLDDFFMIAAMASPMFTAIPHRMLTICYVIMLFILRTNHIGFPKATLNPGNMVAFIKTTLAIQVMYYTNIFCIKTSILLTYVRFAVSKTFRNLCYGTITLHGVFFFICFVVTLAQCRPLRVMWDLTGSVPGTCINTTAFFYFTSAFNIITDIWILSLPFKTLRAIQRPQREKVALFLIFGVGAFAATASIVRLHTIYIYTLSEDPFRDGIPVNLWSMIEVTVAISCASVSALKPIFSRRQRAASRAAKSTSTGSGMQY